MYHWDGSRRALLARGGDGAALQQNVSELSTARAFVAPGAANALYHAHISGSPS
jgi:hypothetical protein